MSAAKPNSPSVGRSPCAEMKILGEMLIVLSTGPLLLGILGTQAAMNFLEEMGKTSEEIFRGERLPLLKFQDSVPFNSN